MEFYTTEFCKFCNVGREALRLYEKLGLISPRINPDNRYRIYDAWDASRIAEIKHYQALGFSLKEITNILESNDLSQTIESMENSVSIYRNRIGYYQMLCKKTEEELGLIRRIPEMLGHYFTRDLPELVYCQTPDKRQGEHNQEKTNFMQYLDFFMPCICLDRNYSGNEARGDYSGWGVLIRREYADYLNIHDGITIPSSKAFCSVIDAGEKGTLSRSLFSNFLSRPELDAHEPAPVYGALLARTHDTNGHYHRYLFTFARI